MKETKLTQEAEVQVKRYTLEVSYEKISNIKKLFEIVNSLKKAVTEGSNEDMLSTLFDGLKSYAEFHFTAEEQIMRSYGYKELEHHKQEHEAFYEKAIYYKETFNKNTAIGHAAVIFLHGWLNEHAKVSDKKVADFLLEKRKAIANKRDDNKKRIGDLLLQKGIITRYQLEQALERQKELERQGVLKLVGTILMDMQFITSDKMIKFIKNNNIKVPLGEYLLIDKKINEEQLIKAKEIQQQVPGRKIGDIFVHTLKVITEEELLSFLAKQHQVARVKPDISDVDPDFFFLFKKEWLLEAKIVPYRRIDEENNNNIVCQIIVHEPDIAEIQKLESIVASIIIKSYNDNPANKGKPHLERKNIAFEYSLAALSEIENFISTVYDNREALLFSRKFKVDVNENVKVITIGKNYFSTNSNLNIFIKILTKAIDLGVSDIHIEPLSDKLQVRFRIDGVLIRQPDLPKTLNNVFIRGLKNYLRFKDSHLQNVIVDDRKSVYYADKNMAVDLRISVLPSMYGDTMVIRLLVQNKDVPTFKQLGMCKNIMSKYNLLCSTSSGLIIVTGPTGSGKTTTLFSTIDTLNEPDTKILTLEDPPEYQIPGVMQVTVSGDGKREVKYIDALKSALRQDPDIIMFGELRDYDSATVAFNAGLTGHLLFTTLHTNDATSTIVRLFELGVSPYLLSSTLVAVVAQRLVRVICRYCKEETTINPKLQNYFSIHIADIDEMVSCRKLKFYKGRGCAKCDYTGYKGRLAIHELLCINKDVRKLIQEKATANEIEASARQFGMTSMMEDGFLKVVKELTTAEEVERVAKTFTKPKLRRTYDEIEHLLEGELTNDEINKAVFSA
ncbi:MAG: Flp pilus assembly complex ATPase component TadA [Candidatus Magnetoovum sp. WYHC-5]|nr:Flp pilus assembly complex ATPase component TadA [Candidatus Magnetoovum sp. WYHC-5]